MAVVDQLHHQLGTLLEGILVRKASTGEASATAAAAAASASASVLPRAPIKAIDSIALWGKQMVTVIEGLNTRAAKPKVSCFFLPISQTPSLILCSLELRRPRPRRTENIKRTIPTRRCRCRCLMGSRNRRKRKSNR